MNLDRIFEDARNSAGAIAGLSDERRSELLCMVADAVDAQAGTVLAANAKDLDRMDAANPKRDRLALTAERLNGITEDMRRVAGLPSPLGKTLLQTVRPNGLKICKISVPLGVVGMIYEARPNVTLDVFSLCLKSGNVSILKGSRDAESSNATLAAIIRGTLSTCGLPSGACTLLPADRDATFALLNARKWVDLVIPRGSRALIDFVRENARVPIIETGAGICHCYVDKSADITKAAAIVNNAKTRRVSVCNALDCLLVHEARVGDIAEICAPLSRSNVEIFADEKGFEALAGTYPESLLKHASEDSYGTEFLDYKMSLRVVSTLDEALAHIARYGSHHSEAIVSDDPSAVALFQKNVDAACVYANASTAFTDGGEFGFGAEIGISTQKLHARGPMGLDALTTCKYVITGDGQVR